MPSQTLGVAIVQGERQSKSNDLPPRQFRSALIADLISYPGYHYEIIIRRHMLHDAYPRNEPPQHENGRYDERRRRHNQDAGAAIRKRAVRRHRGRRDSSAVLG